METSDLVDPELKIYIDEKNLEIAEYIRAQREELESIKRKINDKITTGNIYSFAFYLRENFPEVESFQIDDIPAIDRSERAKMLVAFFDCDDNLLVRHDIYDPTTQWVSSHHSPYYDLQDILKGTTRFLWNGLVKSDLSSWQQKLSVDALIRECPTFSKEANQP